MSFFCRLPPDLGLRTWLATKPRELFQKNLIGVRGRNSCMTPASMCGMILICSEQGLIIYIGDASQMRKHEALFGTATVHPMAVTTVGREQQQTCYNQVFSGLLFLKMLTSLCVVVINAREEGGFLEAMRCPYRTSWRQRLFIVGALTSWGLFLLHTGMSISW